METKVEQTFSVYPNNLRVAESVTAHEFNLRLSDCQCRKQW
jgi:hypothetical protein